MDTQNLTGQTLQGYELREILGVGGMGVVYRTIQQNLERAVAVKVLSGDLAAEPDYIARFTQEAKTAAALEHAHIVPVYDYGLQGDYSYVVMRLLSGGSLEDQMRQRTENGDPLPTLAEIAPMMRQLAGALDYAHARGVIHRDIKPANIMFDDQGQTYLVDFGIAKLLEATTAFTQTGVPIGTPYYMPPEQWRSEPLTAAADQYALAATLYHLLAGKLPFDATTPHGMLYQHLSQEPEPLQTYRPDIPEGVHLVFWRAMQKDPDARYPTTTDFVTAYESAAGLGGGTASRPGDTPTPTDSDMLLKPPSGEQFFRQSGMQPYAPGNNITGDAPKSTTGSEGIVPTDPIPASPITGDAPPPPAATGTPVPPMQTMTVPLYRSPTFWLIALALFVLVVFGDIIVTPLVKSFGNTPPTPTVVEQPTSGLVNAPGDPNTTLIYNDLAFLLINDSVGPVEIRKTNFTQINAKDERLEFSGQLWGEQDIQAPLRVEPGQCVQILTEPDTIYELAETLCPEGVIETTIIDDPAQHFWASETAGGTFTMTIVDQPNMIFGSCEISVGRCEIIIPGQNNNGRPPVIHTPAPTAMPTPTERPTAVIPTRQPTFTPAAAPSTNPPAPGAINTTLRYNEQSFLLANHSINRLDIVKIKFEQISETGTIRQFFGNQWIGPNVLPPIWLLPNKCAQILVDSDTVPEPDEDFCPAGIGATIVLSDDNQGFWLSEEEDSTFTVSLFGEQDILGTCAISEGECAITIPGIGAGNMQQQNTINDCLDKNIGDDCTVTHPLGTSPGSCRLGLEQQLVCIPDEQPTAPPTLES